MNRVSQGAVPDPQLSYPVKVRLARLIPRFDELATVDVMVTCVGEQKTAFEFAIGADRFVGRYER